MSAMTIPQLLWTPSPESVAASQMTAFRLHVSKTYDVPLPTYESLHAWSIANIGPFWSEVWSWTGVIASTQASQVIDGSKSMDSIPKFFEGSRFNWAENMLRHRESEGTALVECSEPKLGEALVYHRTSYKELYAEVEVMAKALRSMGLKTNDILAYYGPTSESSVVLLLAATSLGAIWSSAAADFGPVGVLERFEQFGDRLWGIVGVQSVRYNGKTLSQVEKLKTVVQGLEKGRTGKKLEVVVVDYLREGLDAGIEGWKTYESVQEVGRAQAGELEFYQAPFDHPLWVLFSSGTTGKPKPIVHGAGGMLLQSAKEHVLHGNMSSTDVFFYYTTPGWMMYNYLVSGLQTGATVVLFDGSPLFKPAVLWTMAEDLGVTVFGTSAKYLDVLSQNYDPIKHHDLSKITQILSTGSPLKPELYDWVYKNIKQDVLLGSITGGTDICSLFASHNVVLPVYRGLIQCLALGMALESWSEAGVSIPRGSAGDLVCVKPFPCMPVFFWNDEGGKRYRSSYFELFDGVWAHGDHVIITESIEGNGGGLIMLGRSDGVLNPSGIRFGSSEIYEVIDTFFATSSTRSSHGTIEDSLVVGQKTNGGSDERVVLFVKMKEGEVLGEGILGEIKLRVRNTRSARHVPERILQVSDIPHTINGKKVEVPIKKLLGGAPLSSINRETLRNPECLEEYVRMGSMLRSEVA